MNIALTLCFFNDSRSHSPQNHLTLLGNTYFLWYDTNPEMYFDILTNQVSKCIHLKVHVMHQLTFDYCSDAKQIIQLHLLAISNSF